MSGVKNQENVSVDFAKLFFCSCILFLHAGAYHDVAYGDYLQKTLLSLAVPFFFVTSGYFLGVRIWTSGMEELGKIVFRYEKRLLFPYIAFLILNSCFSAYDLYVSGESFNWTILRLVRAAIFYPPGALWYVWASLTGILILYILVKKAGIRRTCAIGLICYCAGLLGNSYCFLLNGLGIQRMVDLYLKVAVSTRNGLFVGFPLILLGMMLAKYRQRFSEKKVNLSVVLDLYLKVAVSTRNGLFVGFPLILLGMMLAKYRQRFSEKKVNLSVVLVLLISIMLMFGEVAVVSARNAGYETAMLVSYPIIVSAVLILLLNISWSAVNTESMVIFRKLSMDIYFVHRPILTCMRYITSWLEVEISHMNEFFILTILSLVVCMPVAVYQRNKYQESRKHHEKK